MKHRLLSLWKRLIGDKSPFRVFVILICASWFCVLIAAPFSAGYSFRNLFFIWGNDAFMDFFNSMRDVAQGIGVYTERGVIYPPMANLIFLLFSKLVPDTYLNTPFDDRQSWGLYPGAYVALILYVLLLVLAFVAACRYLQPTGQKRSVPFVFLLCEVILFGIERGNIAVLSTAAVLFFLASFDSKNAVIRELALLSLAFAFSIKLYPALFAWLLITNKQYKETVRCAIYAILFLIIPSFFFGGPISLIWTIQNTLRFASDKSGLDGYAVPWHMWTQLDGVKVVYYGILAIAILLFLVISFLRRDRQKNLIMLCTLIMAVPAFQSIYAWALFIAPVILLFKQGWNRWNVVYFILITVPMLPIPITIRERTIGETILPTIVLLLLLACIVDAIHFLVQRQVKPSPPPAKI